MTTLPNPMDVVVAAYRAMVPAPPDVRLDEGAVCPVDDTVLTAELSGWCCPTCLAWWDQRGRAGMWLAADRALAAALVAEDNLEAAGLLAGDDRRTCQTCRVWVNPAHLASTAHWAAIDAAAEPVTLDELVEIACPVPVPDGVHGMCWRPRPCPDHDDQAVLDELGRVLEDGGVPVRMRRLGRRCALAAATIGAGLATAVGYATGTHEGVWRPAWLTDHLVTVVVALALTVALVVALWVFLSARTWGGEGR